MKTIPQMTKAELIAKMRTPIPKSWVKAAGMLKHRKKDLDKHLKLIRKEWTKSN